MSSIVKIALTGGPCSGKTEIIGKIKSIYEAKGYKIYLCPETAGKLIDDGFSRDDMFEFEKAVALKQIEAENHILCKIKDEDNVILICDRGLTDCFSYVDYEKRAIYAETIGVDCVKSWERYDAVIFLETAAINGNYVSSVQRTESQIQAVQCHERLLEVWTGHPHLRYIEYSAVIEDKINDVCREIDCIINNIENEIKLLIEVPKDEFFKKYKAVKCDIEQAYLLSSNGSHRIRKRGVNGSYLYYETVKQRITVSKCYEYENTISESRYNELLKLRNPKKNIIKKSRYCFLYKGQYFELDIYTFWNDKATLELEINCDSQKYQLPPEIVVIKDVTNDKKYKNNYLAGLKL